MTHVTLTAAIWREDNAYVSLCPELGVASCGDTPDEALRMLKEAVELFLENARRLGTWDDIRAPLESPQRFTAPLEVTVP
ncbi:MAG: type II toxin-antitoxin system HicB family antitoxin [Deltaproteobacteria bacterium]|nr:type II toxin-antitoxin system HicB family antitoxin [Deltaproteobacteria bacterium]